MWFNISNKERKNCFKMKWNKFDINYKLFNPCRRFSNQNFNKNNLTKISTIDI